MTTQTTRKQTPAQARKAALESDFAPLYAVAGLTDLLQEAATQRLTELRTRQGELQTRVRGGADELIKFVGSIPAQVKALPDQVKILPSTARTQAAGAQQQAEAFASEVGTRYGDLAGRGKRAVDQVTGRSAAPKKSTPKKTAAQKTGTAKKAPAKKSAAKSN